MSNKLSCLKWFFSIFCIGADVVTVTSGTAGAAGSVQAEMITYLAAKLLDVAELITVLDQFGEKQPIPSGSSKTIRFNREEKLAITATPAQLTEGVPPDAVGIQVSQFEAIAEQYGSLTKIAEVAELTSKHPIVERTIFVLGLQAAETYD